VSGFAGIVRLTYGSESSEIDRGAIARMAQAIAFRGPDAFQQSHLPGASFAFSLLKTGPAPQEPAQPCSLDGNTWLLGDVRCDGRSEIFAKLAQHGTQLSPESTSEQLILHYFAKFGEAGLTELVGDFSLVLWNQQERKLIAFRDLTGSRPFFYSQGEGNLVFGNTLQALLAVPWVSRELDEVFLGDFLLGSPNHDLDRSVYKNIRRLPVGHLLQFSSHGIFIGRIANMPVEEPLMLREREYIEAFRRLFTQAVSDQLAPVNSTIMLSGGLDSTTLAACAVSLRKNLSLLSNMNLRAYTVDSQPLYEDQETYLASRLAANLGIECEIRHFGSVLPFTSPENYENVLIEPSLAPYMHLYNFYFRQMVKNSRIVFSGGGGDEVFRLQALPYLRYLRKRKGLYPALAAVAGYMASHRKLPALGTGIQVRVRSWFGQKMDVPIFPCWLAAEFSRRLELPARWQMINARPVPMHPSNPVAYACVNDGYVSTILETYDSTWTDCPLEVRSPFMDRRLTRFLLRIPAIPWAMDKYLLRRSQIGILPDEIRLREKVPLQGDDVLLHRASGAWDPVPTEVPAERIRSMVDWARLVDTLKQTTGPDLHVHLRPVALALWLKSVENHGSFQ